MQRGKSKLIEACQSWKARRRWNSQLIKRQFLSIIRRAGRKGLAGWHGSKLGATKDIKKRESKQNATKRKRKTNTHEWGFPLVCSSLLLDQTKINSGQIFIYNSFFFWFGQGAGICHLPPPPVGFSFDLACSSKARRFLLLIPFRGQRHHRLVLSSAT